MRAVLWGLILIGLVISGETTPAELGLAIGDEEYATYRFYGMLAIAVLVMLEGIMFALRRPAKQTQTESVDVKNEVNDTVRDLEDRIRRLQREKDESQASRGDQEVMNFVSLLQAKGRLVDFLMDDITQYGDVQIGAAARVVHQGCAQVMRDYFDIKPVASASNEGDTMTLDADYDPSRFKILGKTGGEPPFSGKVLHRGWHTESIRLPQTVQGSAQSVQIIAPAEVEIH